ncbi:MAG: HD domain-containing protein, partial [Phycisphaerales bacterium]|nr:HD domain-containing protein [Phycisphaerales bacterium]
MIVADFKARLADATPQQFAIEMAAFFNEHGQTFYDESVRQIEHATQCAALAASEDGREDVIVAALLHDVGHLLEDEHAEDDAFLREDLFHEDVAADFLEPFFGPTVIDPILHHVAAKRYLCAVDRAYHDGLSPAS